MNTKDLLKIGSNLVRRCGTRDPFSIAKQIGVEVLLCKDLASLKGMYRVIQSATAFIILNGDLDDQMQRIVCAHELGHDQLHRVLQRRVR